MVRDSLSPCLLTVRLPARRMIHLRVCKNAPLAMVAAQLNVCVPDGGMVMLAAASVVALGAWSASKHTSPSDACFQGTNAALTTSQDLALQGQLLVTCSCGVLPIAS